MWTNAPKRVIPPNVIREELGLPELARALFKLANGSEDDADVLSQGDDETLIDGVGHFFLHYGHGLLNDTRAELDLLKSLDALCAVAIRLGKRNLEQQFAQSETKLKLLLGGRRPNCTLAIPDLCPDNLDKQLTELEEATLARYLQRATPSRNERLWSTYQGRPSADPMPSSGGGGAGGQRRPNR